MVVERQVVRKGRGGGSRETGSEPYGTEMPKLGVCINRDSLPPTTILKTTITSLYKGYKKATK